MAKWIIILLLVTPAFGQEHPAKLAHLFTNADSVSADGVWRPDDLNEKTELAFDAVTHLECHKHGGMDLVNADA